MRRFIAFGPAVLVLLVVCVALLAAPSAIKRVQVAHIAARVSLANATLDGSDALDAISRETESIADAVMPGTVHIAARWNGSGAGWFYDESGHVVTNAHVVGEAETVRIELYDGRVQRAPVIARDVLTDIAVLKADPGPGVSPLRRATGEDLRVGQRVFAFGSPFGIKFSMSDGIVSGLGRAEAAPLLQMVGGYTNFIQTDAAMNPGNSGGPLVNTDGRVVGMSAAIANNVRQDDEERPLQGQSAGIGFAIPLETIEAVVDQLLETPEIVLRGYLGVQMTAELNVLKSNPAWGPSREFAAELGAFEGSGVLLSRVQPGQPAARAGLRTGDIIVSINGRDTPTTDVLRGVVSVQEPSTPVDVRIFRDGAYETITMRLGAAIAIPRGGLEYIPGSESMSLEEARRAARERMGEE